MCTNGLGLPRSRPQAMMNDALPGTSVSSGTAWPLEAWMQKPGACVLTPTCHPQKALGLGVNGPS